MGKDQRFDDMRPFWNRFIKFWILQGLSVWIIALPCIWAFSSSVSEITNISLVGLVIWFFGFILEWTADYY
jgi:steroid 5-alpha reductase family enzyme